MAPHRLRALVGICFYCTIMDLSAGVYDVICSRKIHIDRGVIRGQYFFVDLFVCLIRLITSHQQSFSYKGTGLPGLIQY